MCLSNPPYHCFPIRVYYENTDAGGIVYHAEYLNFCERARTEWFRELIGSLRDFARDRNLMFVVRDLNAHYIFPARFDDDLVVRTHVREITGTQICLEQSISLKDSPKNCFTLTVNLVCVENTSGRLRRLPEDVLKILKM